MVDEELRNEMASAIASAAQKLILLMCHHAVGVAHSCNYPYSGASEENMGIERRFAFSMRGKAACC